MCVFCGDVCCVWLCVVWCGLDFVLLFVFWCGVVYFLCWVWFCWVWVLWGMCFCFRGCVGGFGGCVGVVVLLLWCFVLGCCGFVGVGVVGFGVGLWVSLWVWLWVVWC